MSDCFQQCPRYVLWGQARPPVMEVRMLICLCKDPRPSFRGGGLPSREERELGRHPPGPPPRPAVSSWIQCSWTLRPWTTLMRTATSHPSSWRSVQLSVSGPTPSGTLSSPCKVSKGEKRVGGGSPLQRTSPCPLFTEDGGRASTHPEASVDPSTLRLPCSVSLGPHASP